MPITLPFDDKSFFRSCPQPGLSPFDIFSASFAPPGGEEVWPQIYRRNYLLTESGRTAIFLLRALLGLEAGAEVIISAYNCGTEVDALLSSGLHLRYIDCEPSGFISLDALRGATTSSTRLLFVIHPFGWPQPLDSIDAWRKERGLLLVEDCALALFSSYPDDSPIGVRGEASVFTLTKSLPCPDGGILTWNDESAQLGSLKTPPVWRTIRQVGSRNMAWLRRHLPVRSADVPAIPVSDNSLKPTTPEMPAHYYFENWRAGRSCSSLTARLISQIEPATIKQRRRDNYLILSRALQKRGFELLFPTLAAGVCPLSCPIRLDGRDHISQELAQFGIEAPPWWAGGHRSINWDRFPVASKLKRTILPLPVHQHLDETDMEYIADVTEQIYGRVKNSEGDRLC